MECKERSRDEERRRRNVGTVVGLGLADRSEGGGRGRISCVIVAVNFICAFRFSQFELRPLAYTYLRAIRRGNGHWLAHLNESLLPRVAEFNQLPREPAGFLKSSPPPTSGWMERKF